jgi:hypothetical protein
VNSTDKAEGVRSNNLQVNLFFNFFEYLVALKPIFCFNAVWTTEANNVLWKNLYCSTRTGYEAIAKEIKKKNKIKKKKK